MAKQKLLRVLGLKESISMTIGTVVGVGLFTCGSSQIGLVGAWIIGFTFVALLISIWPCLIYGEMSAALPQAGGTYNFAKRGLNRVWANMAGWHYIVSVVAIGAGETLAFANYFSILMESLGVSMAGIDPRIIACILVAIFLVLNYFGIKQSGKAQNIFIFFFWACSICWFIYMIPHIHLEYFGGFGMDKLPPFEEIMYIFGLVWWCYTGFETCVSVGGETKYPQYTLPRALKLSVFLVFAVNALFQWFLVGLVSHDFYGLLATAAAPYAEGLKAAGLVGGPIILLCVAPGHCSPSSLYLLHGRRPFVTFRICQGTPQIQNPSRGHPAGRCHQLYFDCDRLHQLHCLGFIDFTGRMLHDWLSGLYGTEKTVSGNETPLQGSLWNLGMLHHHFRLPVHALFCR